MYGGVFAIFFRFLLMQKLLGNIRTCNLCSSHLPHGCRPVLQASSKSKIAIIGQAPGRKVHESGIPWDDKSGDTLRTWMGVSKEQFYDPDLFALIPMGFCYPGKGKSGDLPPRPECAAEWHEKLWDELREIKLTLLLGQYAQNHYLRLNARSNLTETVLNFEAYLPEFFPLPHPSPRNNIWLKKNSWFIANNLAALKNLISSLISQSLILP
jgi:uracil-DNA glycosylase